LGEHESLREKERHILKEFRTRFVAYRGEAPEDDLGLAILAQHHGAPSRLLDWTLNPLAALFFAVEGADQWQDDRCDCRDVQCTPVVWGTAGHRYRVSDVPTTRFDNLWERPIFVIPDRIENRAAVQSSILAVWRSPWQPFDKLPGVDRIWRIRVERSKARHILWALHCVGIDRETLFPDPDGLGGYLAWKHRAVHRDEFERAGRPEPRNG